MGMEINVTLSPDELTCPTCLVEVGHLEMRGEPPVARIDGWILICNNCAAFYLVSSPKPPYAARSLTQREKAILREDPMAPQYQALQRRFELDICPND